MNENKISNPFEYSLDLQRIIDQNPAFEKEVKSYLIAFEHKDYGIAGEAPATLKRNEEGLRNGKDALIGVYATEHGLLFITMDPAIGIMHAVLQKDMENMIRTYLFDA